MEGITNNLCKSCLDSGDSLAFCKHPLLASNTSVCLGKYHWNEGGEEKNGSCKTTSSIYFLLTVGSQSISVIFPFLFCELVIELDIYAQTLRKSCTWSCIHQHQSPQINAPFGVLKQARVWIWRVATKGLFVELLSFWRRKTCPPSKRPHEFYEIFH